MIEYDLGVPGSGKTYKAVYSLYSNFGINPKLKDSKFVHNDVDFAYTNINEIKLDSFDSGTIKKLDWDLFYDNLTTLHAHYTDKKTDSELIELAKNYDLFRCLIIIDECHNYLDRNDKVLIWWLSYHRHLHHQIYLITQNLALVYTKYKSFSEFFYVAKSSSLKLFKSKMVYSQFTNSRLSEKSKSGTIKIPFIKEIYDTYHSGANQQSQNILKKFIVIAISFFILLMFILLSIQSYWTKDLPKEEQIQTPINNPVQQTQTTQSSNNAQTNQTVLIPQVVQEEPVINLKLFKFNCFDTFCYYQQENKNTIEIPLNMITSFVKNIDEDKKYFYMEKNRLVMYLLVDENKFNFLKGVQNEQNQNILGNGLGSIGIGK